MVHFCTHFLTFSDTFVLFDDNGNRINGTSKGIAWSSDVDKKFNNPPEGTKGIFLVDDFKDENFIVWMRTAGLPNFRKLYNIIHSDIKPGKYRIEIANSASLLSLAHFLDYPVSQFDGKKSVVLSTTSWVGGKNSFLGWAYIVVGVICFFQGVAFGLKHKISPRCGGLICSYFLENWEIRSIWIGISEVVVKSRCVCPFVNY